jgi:hypothetical protein
VTGFATRGLDDDAVSFAGGIGAEPRVPTPRETATVLRFEPAAPVDCSDSVSGASGVFAPWTLPSSLTSAAAEGTVGPAAAATEAPSSGRGAVAELPATTACPGRSTDGTGGCATAPVTCTGVTARGVTADSTRPCPFQTSIPTSNPPANVTAINPARLTVAILMCAFRRKGIVENERITGSVTLPAARDETRPEPRGAAMLAMTRRDASREIGVDGAVAVNSESERVIAIDVGIPD